MMRGCAVAWVALACCALAWGQDTAVSDTRDFDRELQRIGLVREQRTAELDAQDAACLNRFAVNDCQNTVAVRRRQVLAELKRQEALVKDAQRQQKAVEQLQRSADKAAESVGKANAIQDGEPTDTPADRQKALDEKVRKHQQQAKPAPRASAPKVASNLDEAAQARNREAYLEKQQAAQKRRKEREQRLIDHGPGAPPLPMAP